MSVNKILNALHLYFAATLIIIALLVQSCEKFVDVRSPNTEISVDAVFVSDQLATAAMLGIYANMISGTSYSSGSTQSISYLMGQAADELIPASGAGDYYLNELTSVSAFLSNLWNGPYQHIYGANQIIEKLSGNSKVNPELANQLRGEAKFIRAFSYYYLASMFGDVPLILSTNYELNRLIGRTKKEDVFKQIIKDLSEARTELSNDYSFSKGERVRPNKWAATALLSRVYLVQSDFQNAEKLATEVIQNKALYDTVALKNVFLKNSKEAIWQISRDDANTLDAAANIIPANATVPPNSSLQTSLVEAFDKKDLRRSEWIGTKISGNKTYYYSNKYKITAATPVNEYSTILRIAELYFIRSEARMHLNKIQGTDGAIADINVIRNRAGLADTTLTDPLLLASLIENEKRLEFFNEWGHRWFDLKRWSGAISGDPSLKRSDDILGQLKPLWEKDDKLLPIPKSQIENAPNMTDAQNPGYD